VAASVASWSGRKSVSFSDVAGETGRRGGASVRCSAGQGWHHDRDLMPCQRACIARPGEGGVHGNVVLALGALGGPTA
jgi:hypothetical protein